MDPKEPAVNKVQRLPWWMRVVMRLTVAAYAVSCAALLHQWLAPYEIKADFRYVRVIAVVVLAIVLSRVGMWLWQRSTKRLAIGGFVGVVMTILALLISMFMMIGMLISARPLLGSRAYDAAATEFSAEMASLTAPNPQLRNAKQAAVSALQYGGPAETRHALALIREAIPILEQDSEDIATLEQRGRDMFSKRDVGSIRTDMYFGWIQPTQDLIDSWRNTNDAAIARFRDLERQLMQRLGDTPP
jgi:uncharacterized membrane protein